MYDPGFDGFRQAEVTEKFKNKNGEVSPLPHGELYPAAPRWVLKATYDSYILRSVSESPTSFAQSLGIGACLSDNAGFRAQITLTF